MARKKVLVTGANGYIGNAVAKAFNRAGWKTYGLIRRAEDSLDLAKHEIHPIIGSPADLKFLEQIRDIVFDVVASNTEDLRNHTGHFEHVYAMLQEIEKQSNSSGIRPLVLFTSGCKDYGTTEKYGDPHLTPHTEKSPLHPPEILIPRTQFGSRLLDQTEKTFDVIVLRPVTVYGYNSCYYGPFFALASHSHEVLKIPGDPNSIMHGLHVDDCAEAYVALAEHANRDEVKNQAFNISYHRYETTKEICDAVGRSYGLKVEFIPPKKEEFLSVQTLVSFSQWVSSEKLRSITGWCEKRPGFAEGVDEYRLAYEAALEAKDPAALRILSMFLPQNV